MTDEEEPSPPSMRLQAFGILALLLIAVAQVNITIFLIAFPVVCERAEARIVETNAAAAGSPSLRAQFALGGVQHDEPLLPFAAGNWDGARAGDEIVVCAACFDGFNWVTPFDDRILAGPLVADVVLAVFVAMGLRRLTRGPPGARGRPEIGES